MSSQQKGKKTKSEEQLKCHRSCDYLETDDRSRRSITTPPAKRRKPEGGGQRARQSWAERKDGSSNAKHLQRASRLAPQTTTERLVARLGTAATIQAGRSKRHLPPTATEIGTSNVTSGKRLVHPYEADLHQTRPIFSIERKPRQSTASSEENKEGGVIGLGGVTQKEGGWGDRRLPAVTKEGQTRQPTLTARS